jgi:hypothetical protein
MAAISVMAAPQSCRIRTNAESRQRQNHLESHDSQRKFAGIEREQVGSNEIEIDIPIG